MANKCSLCGKFASNAEAAKCTKCSLVMHRSCAAGFDPCRASSWRCQMCKEKTKISPTTATDVVSDDAFKDASLGDGLTNSLAEEMRLLRVEMVSVRREISTFRNELANLNANMSDFSKRVDAMDQRLTVVEQNMKQSEPVGEASLMETIAQLKVELNEREQEDLLNDIEIAGLPEKQGENTVHLAALVTKKLGVEINVDDIVSAEGGGLRRAAAGSGDQQRPRLIRVRLARRSLRDDILRAARTRRGADTSGILDGETRRLHVNERLTRMNRHLFYKAREEGRLQNWRFVWTRRGRIFVRRDSGAAVQRIRAETDIMRIFGGSPVRS